MALIFGATPSRTTRFRLQLSQRTTKPSGLRRDLSCCQSRVRGCVSPRANDFDIVGNGPGGDGPVPREASSVAVIVACRTVTIDGGFFVSLVHLQVGDDENASET